MAQEVTFRDFAAAVMTNDLEAARGVLATLLGLPPPRTETAALHFRARMADPAFMPKAMSLRTAVTSGSDDEIRALLGDCFGLGDADCSTALAALRTRYPRTPA